MNTVASTSPLTLHGVHHTARPTWNLKETVEFYRDILGLPLVHAISARGWGPVEHPDFLHFFFDSGDGSTMAVGAPAAALQASRPGRAGPGLRPLPESRVLPGQAAAPASRAQAESKG